MSVDEGLWTVHRLEEEIAGLARLLTAPRMGECVFCFTNRMVVDHGCDHTLRWVRRWRELRAPRATALLRRLRARGAFCDCEVFANGWDVTVQTVHDPVTGEECWPPEVTGCRGVRPGSAQPCTLWQPRPRW
jgi:hypothetical protein